MPTMQKRTQIIPARLMRAEDVESGTGGLLGSARATEFVSSCQRRFASLSWPKSNETIRDFRSSIQAKKW
jgi:hypothetical protein